MILIYLAIFFAKILDMTLLTVVTVLIIRGEKFWSSIIQVIQAVIWVYVVVSVINSITEDPIKVIAYAGGFACGNYLGCILEEKLALGIITLDIISGSEEGTAIANILRDEQIGVTTIDGEGRLENKKILMVHLKRKRKNEIVRLLEDGNYNCVISVNDTKVVYGGYGLRK